MQSAQRTGTVPVLDLEAGVSASAAGIRVADENFSVIRPAGAFGPSYLRKTLFVM